MHDPWGSHAMTEGEIRELTDSFIEAARRDRDAGFDGVDLFAGYNCLLDQFWSPITNKRTDKWGGAYENRIRLPIEIVRRTREAVGPEFVIIYRLSMLDLVKDGSTWEEIVELAQRIEEAGASILNTGIGWHEARVPTIATMVPRAGFTWVTARLKGQVGIPLVTSNRINMPETAEKVLADGDAVSSAKTPHGNGTRHRIVVPEEATELQVQASLGEQVTTWSLTLGTASVARAIVGKPLFSACQLPPPSCVKKRPNSVPTNSRSGSTWSWMIVWAVPRSGRSPVIDVQLLPRSSVRKT